MWSKYLKPDKTLDYQAVYNDMYRIKGGNAKYSREKMYKNITEWYEDYKKNGDADTTSV